MDAGPLTLLYTGWQVLASLLCCPNLAHKWKVYKESTVDVFL